MNQDEFLTHMRGKCPKLFKLLEYIECNEGWHFLIEKMSVVIERDIDHLDPMIAEHIYVVQIKEKFGGLRFYMNESTPHINGVISLADMLSFSICERCGTIGATRRSLSGYIVTLCDHHYEKEMSERIK